MRKHVIFHTVFDIWIMYYGKVIIIFFFCHSFFLSLSILLFVCLLLLSPHPFSCADLSLAVHPYSVHRTGVIFLDKRKKLFRFEWAKHLFS